MARLAHEADFLHRAVATDIGDRLKLIKRDFPLAADIGSHTGRIAETLEALGNVGSVIRTDASFPMLLPDTGLDKWSVCADEEFLPFAPGSLDLICAALNLHFVNDLPGTLRQIFTALKPDGFFVAALFGTGTLIELGQTFLEAETETRGGASPRLIPMADVRDMGALLQRAGFALPVADVETLTVRYESPMGLIQDLRRMGATNILTERSRQPLSRQTLTRALEIYSDRYSDPDGRIRATFEIIHIAGWHPHESQQQPLFPGSAEMRLADALKIKDPTSDPSASGNE